MKQQTGLRRRQGKGRAAYSAERRSNRLEVPYRCNFRGRARPHRQFFRVSLTTKFSDRTLAIQHAGAVSTRPRPSTLCWGRSLQ